MKTESPNSKKGGAGVSSGSVDEPIVTQQEFNSMVMVPKNLTMTHINWVLGGVLLAKEPRSGRVVKRYEAGSILCNEAIIDTSRALSSNVIDLNKIDNVFKFMMSTSVIGMQNL